VNLIGHLCRLPPSVKKLGDFTGFIWNGLGGGGGAASDRARNTVMS
jgi:hypothetical protein